MTSREIKDGGPAFPISMETALTPVKDIYGNDISSGMSLRDYFAAQALVGLLSRQGPLGAIVIHEGAAVEAYAFADALLKARSEKEE